ncbi:MAG: hypothetical protein JW902_16915 [Syntrophaceae bacterium]|nr:hypothetical protein [Syntrophaceae bacterium]
MSKKINELPQSDEENSDCEIAEIAVEEKMQKNPAAVALGRLGGLKGGKARAAKLSPRRRREIAQKAARARWHKKN